MQPAGICSIQGSGSAFVLVGNSSSRFMNVMTINDTSRILRSTRIAACYGDGQSDHVDQGPGADADEDGGGDGDDGGDAGAGGGLWWCGGRIPVTAALLCCSSKPGMLSKNDHPAGWARRNTCTTRPNFKRSTDSNMPVQ